MTDIQTTWTDERNKPRVKPLKWYKGFAHNDMGGSYQLDSAGGGILTLYFHTGVGKVEMTVADNIPELEKAANAHHELRILACLDG